MKNAIRQILTISALLFYLSCNDNSNESLEETKFENVKWKEYGVILEPGEVNSWSAMKADTGNSIILKDSKWWLYHSGQNSTGLDLIGLHISADESLQGPWTDYAGNPIITPGADGEWDSKGVAHPSVLAVGNEIWIYYTGYNGVEWSIGLAKSNDGLAFTKYYKNPVLKMGDVLDWDSGGVTHPSVIADGENYYLAYRGWDSDTTDIHSQIGLCVSKDGYAWNKLENNPVLMFGKNGEWDENGLLAPRLWYHDGMYYINYSGKPDDATEYSSIGHAYANSIDTWFKSESNPLIFAGSTSYFEIEWGTSILYNNKWYMLTTAWCNQGKTILWGE